MEETLPRIVDRDKNRRLRVDEQGTKGRGGTARRDDEIRLGRPDQRSCDFIGGLRDDDCGLAHEPGHRRVAPCREAPRQPDRKQDHRRTLGGHPVTRKRKLRNKPRNAVFRRRAAGPFSAWCDAVVAAFVRAAYGDGPKFWPPTISPNLRPPQSELGSRTGSFRADVRGDGCAGP